LKAADFDPPFFLVDAAEDEMMDATMRQRASDRQE
jgi:hypothetical protein